MVDLSLKESAAFANVQPPSTPLAPVLFVEEVDAYGQNRPISGTGLLRQELFRQAVLIAAREELGLTTRDASLGEMAPTGVPDVARIRVHVRSVNLEAPRSVRIETGNGDKFQPVWATESSVAYHESLFSALRNAVELSRGGYITALKRVGGWAVEPKQVSDKPLPKSVEPALARPTVVSQLYAVRTLHAHMREAGESPAALAAISRGYANLGLLTDRLWDGTTWVFKARSLLYAERLLQLDETAAMGRWVRGYAVALAGRHADALADFTAADKAAGKNTQPDWVPLAVAVCKFDSASLRAKTEDGPLADMALLCLFLTQEEWELPAESIAIGEQFLKRVPECHRVSESISRFRGLGNLRRHSHAGLEATKTGYTEELDRVSGLPQNLFALLQDHASLDELLPALEASGRDAKDRTELSWAVLGRIATESRLTLIESVMSFFRYALGVPTNEFAEKVRPLIESHRLYPVLSVYGFDADRQPENARQALQRAPINWITTRESNRTIHRHFLTAADQNAMHNITFRHGDELYTDQWLTIQPITKDDEAIPYVNMLYVTSPYSPTARARLILSNSPIAQQSLETWKKECQHGIVSVAFAKKAFIDKQFAEAERLYEWAMTFTKDYFVYLQLSELYRRHGEEEKAILTLQESLDTPVDGLEHAQARVTIANHYLAKKDFATARKYAEQAAQTWAGWAMLCASTCAEADSDMEVAEEWVRRTSERYDANISLWYFWCLRTGQGDLQKARQLLDTHLKNATKSQLELDLQAAAMISLADGRLTEAAKNLELCFSGDNTFFLMLAAVVWDQAGESEKRDRLFDKLPAKDPTSPLIQVLRNTLKKGEKATPSKEELDDAWSKLPDWAQNNAGCLVGLFLQHRGEKERAKGYFEISLKSNIHGSFPPTIAGIALRAK